MIFMGNGDGSRDQCNDRLLQLNALFSELSGLQQGLRKPEEWEDFEKRARKFTKQLKRDLVRRSNKKNDTFTYWNKPENLNMVAPAFKTLYDDIRSVLYPPSDEDAPF